MSPAEASGVRGVSVVVPAFNEQGAIAATIADVRAALDKTETGFAESEILVIDDGSTDDTAALAEAAGARVIRLPRNRGYGAALKAGFAAAQHDTVVITDADGTYPASAIPEMLKYASDYEMVIGARVGENAAIPMVRRPFIFKPLQTDTFLTPKWIRPRS